MFRFYLLFISVCSNDLLSRALKILVIRQATISVRLLQIGLRISIIH